MKQFRKGKGCSAKTQRAQVFPDRTRKKKKKV